MNAPGLFHDLKARGMILEAQGEHLKIDAPVGVLTEERKGIVSVYGPSPIKRRRRGKAELEVPGAGDRMPVRGRGRSRQVQEGKGFVEATFPTCHQTA